MSFSNTCLLCVLICSGTVILPVLAESNVDETKNFGTVVQSLVIEGNGSDVQEGAPLTRFLSNSRRRSPSGGDVGVDSAGDDNAGGDDSDSGTNLSALLTGVVIAVVSVLCCACVIKCLKKCCCEDTDDAKVPPSTRTSESKQAPSQETNNSQKTRYLPMSIQGVGRLVYEESSEGNTYRVAYPAGVAYRFRKDNAARDTSRQGPRNNSLVYGKDEGDGWLRVQLEDLTSIAV